MRRKEREMGLEFACQVLDKCEWAVLSMVDGEGFPYGIPLNIVREKNFVYFHGALSGEKAEHLRARPRVCLTAVGDTHILQQAFSTEYECVVIRGNVTELTTPEEKSKALRLLSQRHCPQGMDGFQAELNASLRHTGVWRLDMEQVTAKRHRRGADGKELTFGTKEVPKTPQA